MSDVSFDRKRNVPAPPAAQGWVRSFLSNLWDDFASYCRHQGLNSLSAGTLARLGTTRQDVARTVMLLSHSSR